MKKLVFLVLLLVSLAFMPACSQRNDNNGNKPPVSKPQELSVESLFPIKENVKYEYEGKGNEFASYNVHIDYTSDTRVQQRINNGGTETVRVFEVKEGKVTRVFSKGEVYYRENNLESNGEKEIVLQEPIKKGTTWTSGDSGKKTITGIAVDVSVPAGDYKAVEVTTEGPRDKTIEYYAPGVGLVKSVWISGETGDEVSSSLSKIEENVSLVQNMDFFYPNVEEGQYYYKTRQVSFKTNDITRKVLETAYKEPVSGGLGKVFSPNTKINSLYLNQDNRVYIDLNKAFITEMNAGAGYEGMILQCIANTFGRYYGVQEVILTVDNQPYESGHILFKKGDSIPVKGEGAVKIN